MNGKQHMLAHMEKLHPGIRVLTAMDTSIIPSVSTGTVVSEVKITAGLPMIGHIYVIPVEEWPIKRFH